MLPNVKIDVSLNNLGGVVPLDDGTAGVVGFVPSLTGLTNVQYDKPFAIYSVKEAEAKGITKTWSEAQKVTGQPTIDANHLWHDIDMFFKASGDGSELWVMLREWAEMEAVYESELFSDKTVLDKLIDASNGRIRILFISYMGDVFTNADYDEELALSNLMQALAESFALEMKPFIWVVPFRQFEIANKFSSLPGLRALENYRVAYVLPQLLSSVSANNQSLAPYISGLLAQLPVQRNLGRYKNGSILYTKAQLDYGYAGSAGYTISEDAIHDKGFIICRQYVGKLPVFLSDDPVAAPLSLDLNSISRVRVIDKAMLVAYNSYIEETNDEVLIKEGKLDTGSAKYLQAKVEDAINVLMTSNTNISSVRCTIDPTQDIITTGKLNIDLFIVPVGQLKQIHVQLGFSK